MQLIVDKNLKKLYYGLAFMLGKWSVYFCTLVSTFVFTTFLWTLHER